MRLLPLPIVLLALAAGSACTPVEESGPAEEAAATPAFVPGPPADFERPPIPADNPQTADKVALGKQLYFDRRLSADGTRSCYDCHLVEHGLTDGKPVAEGALGRVLTRSSPTLWNIAYHDEFYWDGRSGSLEAQARAAWTGGNMGADADTVVGELNAVPGYHDQFQEVFGGPATPENVVQAIAAFEREVFYCGDTAYDRWRRGESAAVSDRAQRGAELFTADAGCAACHSGVLFTDRKYHNVGIGMDAEEPDLGRGRVTEEDACSTTADEPCQGAFKTPTLRDISKSAPYFHDGSVVTLEEAVRLMASGGIDNPWIDRDELQDRELNEEQIGDLVAFLETLDCEHGSEIFQRPSLPE